jgi:hypothetical protein
MGRGQSAAVKTALKSEDECLQGFEQTIVVCPAVASA